MFQYNMRMEHTTLLHFNARLRKPAYLHPRAQGASRSFSSSRHCDLVAHIPVFRISIHFILFAGWLATAATVHGFAKPLKPTKSDSAQVRAVPTRIEPPAEEKEPPLRSLTAVQLDSVAALMLLADAHLSVKNYDNAGKFLRAAFAQYAHVDAAGDEETARADSVYTRLVELYRIYLAAQPVLPPETPLAVLLEEDTEHLSVPRAVRARVDSLMKLSALERGRYHRPQRLGKTVEEIIGRGEPRQPPLPPVPIVTNQRVENAISFFLTRGREVYQRWLDRSGQMYPVIGPVLREEGVPEEIFCLAMIESGLNPQAYSRAHAAGIYQFIAETGRRYGLQAGWWYDERRNPEKATRAACQYLRELYGMFGDWYLAMASYNGGEKRITRAIQRSKTKDYWKLRRLPRETRNYVPTYLATLTLFQEPEKWGFQPPKNGVTSASDTVQVADVLDLAVAARVLGITLDELRRRNPELVQFCTDPTAECYPLRVPMGMAKLLFDSLAKLTREEKIRWVDHIVRKGETLRAISRRYGLSERAISELPWNRQYIRNRRVAMGTTLKFPAPVSEAIATATPPGVATVVIAQPPRRDREFVIVRRGDTLTKIAVQNEVTVKELMAWNSVRRGALIRPGQRIWIDPPEMSAVPPDERKIPATAEPARVAVPENRDTTSSEAKPDSAIVRAVTVKKGDSLARIARAYEVSVSQLIEWNGIEDPDIIHPGMALKVRAPTQ